MTSLFYNKYHCPALDGPHFKPIIWLASVDESFNVSLFTEAFYCFIQFDIQ